MSSSVQSRFIHFLQNDLGIPATSVDFALRHDEQMPALLPMVLWKYGLVTLEQLDQIFDWLETSYQ